MEIKIDAQDLAELERIYDKPASWLPKTTSSFTACMVVLEVVRGAITRIKELLIDE